MEPQVPHGRARRTGLARFSALFLVVFLAGVPAALAQTPWIHVEVTDERDESESEGKRSHVEVNLPLSVVRVAIEAAPDDIVSRGRLHLHDLHQDLEIADLRRIWNELREAGDAELVTVEEADETVRIRREGDRILIDVDDHDGDDEVRVDVPVALVDALLSGEGDSLNLSAALAELSGQRGEIVRVRDGESRVRVWIDEK